MKDRPNSRSLAIGLGFERHVVRTMIYELEEFFKRFKIPYEHNKTKATIELTNNSVLMFGSAEKPQSLEGVHLDGMCWIDEGGQMPRLAWEVAQRRTAMRKDDARRPTQIYVTSVPYFHNWLKTDVYDKWMEGDRDIDWIPCKTLDNKDFSGAAIERLRKNWREDKFRVYVLGEWAKPHGLVYPDPEDGALWEDPFEVPSDWPAFAGHDFGFNNPTTGLWARLSPDDVLHVVAEYEVPDLTLEEHVQIWKSWNFHLIDQSWGDPTSPDLIEVANQMGYPMEPGENAVNYGIDLVYDRMKTGRLKVWRGLKTFMDYRNQYVWAQDPHDEDQLLDKPKKPQPAEHLMDALRYMCAGIAGYSQAPTISMGSIRRKQLPDFHLRPTPR